MIDLVLGIGAGKLLLSGGLAGLAWIGQRRVGDPRVAHGLWLLVLAVLLVPALVAVPAPAWVVGVDGAGGSLAPLSGVTSEGVGLEGGAGWTPGLWLVGLWGAGAALAFLIACVRVMRFRRDVLATATPAGPERDALVRAVSRRLGLDRPPRVVVTAARLSPLVWWTGGRARIVLPAELLDRLDEDELGWILAHELAHLRRRDPLVRWVEWAASVVFWWNPVTWWARRQLRIHEELCCDGLVLSALGDPPGARRRYAGALVRVLEFLSMPPRLATPAFASGAEATGRTSHIERRLRMIVSNSPDRRTPRWIRLATRAAAVLVLPLAVVYCGPDAPVAPEVETSTAEAELVELPFGTLTPVDGEIHLEELARHLELALVNGEMDAAEAKARYQAVYREIPLRLDGSVRHEATDGSVEKEIPLSRLARTEVELELRRTLVELEQAVASGEMTPDEAKSRMAETRKRLEIHR